MLLCKHDVSKECNGKYKNCTDCILDKIRAEIIQMPTISSNANDIYKADVLAIINKHKTERDK